MNRQETIKILAMIKLAYDKFNIPENDEEADLQIDTWQDVFSAEPYKIVEQAVKSLMCTLKFSPAIADIKEKIALITQPRELSEFEAWNIVLNAIQCSNYDAQRQFDNLPDNIKRIVGNPNQLKQWASMESKDVNTVLQSNFMRSYKARTAQEKEYNILPESSKALISQLSNKFMLGG